MENRMGVEKPGIQALPRIQDRMTFIYLERCKISRENGAITVTEQEGVTSIPAAAISVLLLGPGTDVTHRAMELIGDAGVTVIWVGEHGVRYYAYGRALTSHATRGREGSRIRSAYREQAKKWGVPWTKRDYRPDDYEAGDPVNKALSAGNACLYGLAHAVICALGCSPGLGFVHVGHELAFVYDIADLYKAETTIPVAFEMAAEDTEDIGSAVRRRLRDELRKMHILDRMVHDIKFLLSDGEWEEEDYKSTLYLWDNLQGELEHGVSYAEVGDRK